MAVAEAKAILAFEQFLFSVIYPITLQPSFPREGFMVVAGWFECFSGSQFVAVCPGGSCCGSALDAAAATSNLKLLQFSSCDHSDAHRNLTKVEKYRSLLV